ncbi:MAG TPA: ClpX C4-type zinc finger protein [Candidatus Kapabacteria bacterium]|nr:ClpX C4-type zinc finger protein [Candidatus Kapabacteria bacterium]
MSDEPKLTGRAKTLWNKLSAREKLAFLQRFREVDAGTLSQEDACRELEAIVAQFAREQRFSANRQKKNLSGVVDSASVCSFCGKGFTDADAMVKARSGAVICNQCLEKFRGSESS